MGFLINQNNSFVNVMPLGQSPKTVRLSTEEVGKQSALNTLPIDKSLQVQRNPVTAPTQLSRIVSSGIGQIYDGAISIFRNISDFSDSARTQRIEDQKNGTAILQGSKSFSSNVVSFYDFLGRIDSSKLNRDEIGGHLGSLAKEHMQNQASWQIANVAKELFPETTKEVISVLGAKTTTSSQQIAQGVGNGLMTDTSATLGSIGGKVLGWAGAAYSIYELFKGKLDPTSAALSGMSSGAYIGSAIMPPWGTAIGAVVGGIAGFCSSLFGSGKPKEQKERDVIRKQLQSAGILDSDWHIDLAANGRFDIGKDGGAKLINKDGNERKYKEFDLSNPLTVDVAQIAAPLAQSICGGNARLAQEFTAYFTNAATSNTDSIDGALQNLQVIYAKFGVPIEQVLQGLAQQQAQTMHRAA